MCKHATPKALLVEIEGKEHWIPLSQVVDDSEVFNDTSASEGMLVITRWIAEQKGIGERDEEWFLDEGSLEDWRP